MDFETNVLSLLTEIKDLLVVATSRTEEDEKIKSELQKLRNLEVQNKMNAEEQRAILLKREMEARNAKR